MLLHQKSRYRRIINNKNMDPRLQKMFASSAPVPSGLESRIMVRVEKAARRRFFERAIAGSVASVAFAFILFVVGRETLSEIATSGFGQYLSLIWSNGGSVLADWRDFGWTIAESAPITGFALCLGTVGFFVAAVRWTGRAVSGWNGTSAALTI